MKTSCATIIIVLLSFSSIRVVNAQNVKEKASLDNTEQFYIASKYVQGENYRIQVGLPTSYYSSQKIYPVVYVLDGDRIFGMTKDIAECLIMGNDIKDIIVIGISYGQGFDYWGDKRLRDFTDCPDTAYARINPINGGADNFLKFLQFELLPVVNKSYRTKPDSIGLIGWSLGGYFCSYILFKQPELFKNYVIFSPVWIWNNKILLKSEMEYFRTHKELNSTVFISYGSLDFKDWVIGPTEEFIRNIQTHNYKGLNFEARTFEGETHHSVPSAAITHGLKTLFRQ
jgi:uncharacterized protein